MAIRDKIKREIERKAREGIQMTDPTKEKQSYYDKYKSGLNKPKTPTAKTTNRTANTTKKKSDNNYVQSYSDDAQVGGQFLEQARNTNVYTNPGEGSKAGGYLKAGQWMDDDSVREIGYYEQLKKKYRDQVYDIRDQIIDSREGGGYPTNWVQNNPEAQEAMKKVYAIEDHLLDKYNIGSSGNTTRPGLSRSDLGFDESGQAVQQGNDIYEDTGRASYFNDPRNQGQTFNYMNYISPEAMQGQRQWTAKPLDYYYSTNFVRDHKLLGDRDGDGVADTPDNPQNLYNIFNWRSSEDKNLNQNAQSFNIQQEIARARENYGKGDFEMTGDKLPSPPQQVKGVSSTNAKQTQQSASATQNNVPQAPDMPFAQVVQNLESDPGFLYNEYQRANAVLADRQARGEDTSEQAAYLDRIHDIDQQKHGGLGIYRGETRDRIQKEINNYIDSQAQAINQSAERQQQANSKALAQNQNYLNEQIGNIQKEQGQANNQAAQLQNRRGGFYSGGLDYQQGQIAQSSNEARENLRRDIGTQNASIQEKNALIAQQAAQQIEQLRSQAPDLVRQRVNDAVQRYQNRLMQEAQMTGQYLGQDTLQQQRFNQQQSQAEWQRQVQEQQLQSEREQLLYQRALQRLQTFGSVQTEEDAQLLGIPVGTPTYAVRQDQLARAQARASGGSSGGGSYGGSSGGSVDGGSPSSAWAQLDPLDQGRIMDIYNNGTDATRAYYENLYPEVFGGGGGSQQVDANERDLEILSSAFSQAVGGDLANATSQDVRAFVNSQYNQNGWNEAEANYVEEHIMGIVQNAKRQQEQQQMQREKERERTIEQRQEITKPNAIYDPSNFGKGL